MDEQTSERLNAMEERIGTVETEVAVIQSNYVKRDEFAALRADNAENFRGVEHQFGDVQHQFGEVHREFGEVQRQFGELRAEIAQMGATMVKWIVATDLAFFVAIVTAVHYIR